MKLFLAFDFDDTLTNAHTFKDTEITYAHLKHPKRIADLLQQASQDGHLFAIVTECPFEDKIRAALSLMFEGDVSQIPIIRKSTDENGKNSHVIDAMKVYGVSTDTYRPIVVDDGSTNAEAALKKDWGAIIAASEHTIEMSNDPNMDSHIETLAKVIENPETYLEICAKHNKRFGVYPVIEAVAAVPNSKENLLG